MRTLKFLKGILIPITVTRSRHDENVMEEQIITKKQRLDEGWRSEITDERLSKVLKKDATVGQKLKISR